ncbi:MAG: glycosyltransferase [Vampirovibrio sp.]|nr:glycosyltransferase [Vampirovibrio sp.]
MPHLLKDPVGDSKGILMLTHKEKAFFQPEVPFMDAAMKELKKQYVVGMHWGSPHENIGTLPYIDFHLGSTNTLKFAPDVTTPRNTLCARNFLPDCFNKMAPETRGAKRWDILSVAGPRRLKRLDELLVVLRKVYDRRPETRTLIICACPNLSERDPELDYVEIYDDYLKMFSLKEREKFTLMLLEGNQGMPILQEDMAYFYNQSRIFTLFTNKEGDPRVIPEALLCGLPVVVKKHLAGGGKDYLNEANSREFSTLDEAAEVFLDLLRDDCPEVDPNPYQTHLLARHTVPQLEAWLKELFAQLDIPYEGTLYADNLVNTLPGHLILTLPPNKRYASSNDLISHQAALWYVYQLLNRNILPYENFALWAFNRGVTGKSYLKQLLKRPGAAFRKLRLLPPKKYTRATA